MFRKLKLVDPETFTFDKPEITIWVDEKWLYLKPCRTKVRTVGNSRPKAPHDHSQRSCSKVAIAEPFGAFDGKIGIYAFTTIKKAVRSSKNRDAGSDVLVDVPVNSEAYQNVLHQVIKDASNILKDELARGLKVVIQQDGAKPHGMGFKKDMSNALKRRWCRWREVTDRFILETQPPQSPDFNLCDLSFFWSLQKASVLQEGRHSDLESMQTAVIQAFKTYDPVNLKRQCAHMYSIFREILANGGETDYGLPHEGIRKRRRELGIFADPLCNKELRLEAAEHISRLSESQGIDQDSSDDVTV